jgi:2-haloacid dehalogenase
MPIRAVVFDAYGTLLDVHSATLRHAAKLGAGALAFSADWRAKQLEYSWVRSLTGPAHHQDFWACTRDALAWTAARHDVSDPELLTALLASYRILDAFPEVPTMLRSLRGRGLQTAILSNGTPMMLAGFHAIRVNRQGTPDEYGLEAAGVPSIPNLSSLPGLLA